MFPSGLTSVNKTSQKNVLMLSHVKPSGKSIFQEHALHNFTKCFSGAKVNQIADKPLNG